MQNCTYRVTIHGSVREQRLCMMKEVLRYGMEFETGDIIKLKKQHPCGSCEWEVLRTGADFRLKCLRCGRQIMLPRRDVEKNLRVKK